MKSRLTELWSPWRADYVASDKSSTGTSDMAKESCFLCESHSLPADSNSLVIHKGTHNFIILNKYPYSTGHLLVVPYSHEGNLLNLSRESREESTLLIDSSVDTLVEEYRPDGFNIGMNLGRAAGAGVPDHIHIHVVPRWNCDTNFIPVIGPT